MDSTATAEPAHVPFALYHGSSSHYLANFRPGDPVSHWPHRQAARDLYRRVWTELKGLGHAPDWWQERTLAQESGHANWQHGQLYVTPSMRTAVNYAGGGAAHGGELLQMCKDALDRLAELDRRKSTELLRGAGSISRFLEETGLPILIEFGNVRISGLSPERASRNLGEQLAQLADLDEHLRELVAQQTNFRLAPGCGSVARVFELSIDDVGNPVSNFQLREIADSDLWVGAGRR